MKTIQQLKKEVQMLKPQATESEINNAIVDYYELLLIVREGDLGELVSQYLLETEPKIIKLTIEIGIRESDEKKLVKELEHFVMNSQVRFHSVKW